MNSEGTRLNKYLASCGVGSRRACDALIQEGGVTINGANHVIILNTEWSPETTLQAEDRCHRPGQTKDVHIHYILSAGTVEEQMWDLISAKAAAQRAVFDKEALYQSVEQVMAEAVSAQMKVAQAVIAVERESLVVEAAVEHEQPVNGKQAHQLTMADLFQRHGAQPKRERRREHKPVMARQLDLFGASQAAASPA